MPASPAPPSSLVHHPGLSQHLVDPVPGPAVPSLTGTDFGDLTQQGPARSGVRSARSYSSPPLASGMNASLSASSLYPGPNPSLGVQSASAAIAAVTNQRYVWVLVFVLESVGQLQADLCVLEGEKRI